MVGNPRPPPTRGFARNAAIGSSRLAVLSLAIAISVIAYASPVAAFSRPSHTTVAISLPDTRTASVSFAFHPSANRTAVQIFGAGPRFVAIACAATDDFLWGRYWHGCLPIPAAGTFLPADDGSMHVGVVITVVNSSPLKDAKVNITYLPGDYFFSLKAVVPTPHVAKYTVRTSRPALLGSGVGATCGGRFAVSIDNNVTVRRTLRVGGPGTWVNELARSGTSFTISLSSPRCTQSGVTVGLGTATGSPGGP